MSVSKYIHYEHVTYQCDTCHGYGTNTVGNQEIVCGVCHGIGCVGDSGKPITVLPSTVSTIRRNEFRAKVKKMGAEAAAKDSREKQRKRISDNYKAAKRRREAQNEGQ